MVERDVSVEVKAVSRIEPIHEAQVIAYLKLSNRQLGLLINFNVKVLKNSIRTTRPWISNSLCALSALCGAFG